MVEGPDGAVGAYAQNGQKGWTAGEAEGGVGTGQTVTESSRTQLTGVYGCSCIIGRVGGTAVCAEEEASCALTAFPRINAGAAIADNPVAGHTAKIAGQVVPHHTHSALLNRRAVDAVGHKEGAAGCHGDHAHRAVRGCEVVALYAGGASELVDAGQTAWGLDGAVDAARPAVLVESVAGAAVAVGGGSALEALAHYHTALDALHSRRYIPHLTTHTTAGRAPQTVLITRQTTPPTRIVVRPVYASRTGQVIDAHLAVRKTGLAAEKSSQKVPPAAGFAGGGSRAEGTVAESADGFAGVDEGVVLLTTRRTHYLRQAKKSILSFIEHAGHEVEHRRSRKVEPQRLSVTDVPGERVQSHHAFWRVVGAVYAIHEESVESVDCESGVGVV